MTNPSLRKLFKEFILSFERRQLKEFDKILFCILLCKVVYECTHIFYILMSGIVYQVLKHFGIKEI